jgi:hypothetical protein
MQEFLSGMYICVGVYVNMYVVYKMYNLVMSNGEVVLFI